VALSSSLFGHAGFHWRKGLQARLCPEERMLANSGWPLVEQLTHHPARRALSARCLDRAGFQSGHGQQAFRREHGAKQLIGVALLCRPCASASTLQDRIGTGPSAEQSRARGIPSNARTAGRPGGG